MKTRNGTIVACLVFLTALFILPFHGTAEEKNVKIYQKITTEETENLLKELGLFPELKKHSAGKTYFTFQIGGYKVGLVLHGCAKNDKEICTELQMRSYFNTKKRPKDKTLLKTNEWNKKKRWLKSYVDNEGDVGLETNLDIRGGVTKQTIENFIKDYPLLLNQFVKEF